MTSTTFAQIPGKVAAQAGNGFVSVRNGGGNVTCAVTAIIPGNGGQRPVGAVIQFFAKTDAAEKAAAKINANGGDWSEGRVVPAVQALGQDGKVNKEATKTSLWLHAENIFNWLAAEAGQKVAAVPSTPKSAPKPSGKRQLA